MTYVLHPKAIAEVVVVVVVVVIVVAVVENEPRWIYHCSEII